MVTAFSAMSHWFHLEVIITDDSLGTPQVSKRPATCRVLTKYPRQDCDMQNPVALWCFSSARVEESMSIPTLYFSQQKGL